MVIWVRIPTPSILANEVQPLMFRSEQFDLFVKQFNLLTWSICCETSYLLEKSHAHHNRFILAEGNAWQVTKEWVYYLWFWPRPRGFKLIFSWKEICKVLNRANNVILFFLLQQFLLRSTMVTLSDIRLCAPNMVTLLSSSMWALDYFDVFCIAL